VQAVREPLPAELNSAVQAMGQSFWEVAQQLANESLDAAKIAFENEKSDLLQLQKSSRRHSKNKPWNWKPCMVQFVN
jgi:hypothetical protein